MHSKSMPKWSARCGGEVMNKQNISEDVKNFLTSFGSIAELLWFFYSKLKHEGFSNEQAMQFCLCYLNAIATPRKKNDKS